MQASLCFYSMNANTLQNGDYNLSRAVTASPTGFHLTSPCECVKNGRFLENLLIFVGDFEPEEAHRPVS